MMPEVILATIQLIALHKLDGRVTYVNPLAVVQLAETKDAGAPGKQFTDAVKCVITLSDDTYVTVRETCDEVRDLFTEANEEEHPR